MQQTTEQVKLRTAEMSFGHSESTMGPDNHEMNFYRTSTQYCENIHLTITTFLEYSHYGYILVEISFTLQ